MKMSRERYNLLLASMRTVVDHFGPADVRRYAKKHGKVRTMWGLLYKAIDQLGYHDNHPFFLNGTWTRILPNVEGFNVYDDNGTSLNDSHIETALKSIFRELKI